MSTITEKLRRLSKKNAYVYGRVLAKYNNLCTVRVANNGPIYSNIPLVGSAEVGETILIELTTGKPKAVGGSAAPDASPATAAEQAASRFASIVDLEALSEVVAPHFHTEGDILDLDHDADSFLGVELDDTGLSNGDVYIYNDSTGKFEVGPPIQSTLESTNYASGTSGWHLDASGWAEFGDVMIRGVATGLVFKRDTISVIANRNRIAEGAVFVSDCDSSDTSVDIDVPAFRDGDILQMSGANGIEWVKIIGYYSEIETGYRYNIQRNLNGAGTINFSSGETLVYSGNSASSDETFNTFGNMPFGETYFGGGIAPVLLGGFLTLDGSRNYGPYVSVTRRVGPIYNQLSDVMRIGLLKNFLGITEEKWGIAVGDNDDWLKYTDTDGLEISMDGGETKVVTSGLWSKRFHITDDATSPDYVDGKGILFLKNGSLYLRTKDGAIETEVQLGSTDFLKNIVEDLTPELGGHLDAGLNNITNLGQLKINNDQAIYYADSTSADRKIATLDTSDNVHIGHVDGGWGSDTFLKAASTLYLQVNGITGTPETALTIAPNKSIYFAGHIVLNQNNTSLWGKDNGGTLRRIFSLDSNNNVVVGHADGTGGANAYFRAGANAYVQVGGASTWKTALTALSNGNVGINNSSPQYNLDVGGTIHATGGDVTAAVKKDVVITLHKDSDPLLVASTMVDYHFVVPETLDGWKLISMDFAVNTPPSTGYARFHAYNENDAYWIYWAAVIDQNEYNTFTSSSPGGVVSGYETVSKGDRIRFYCSDANGALGCTVMMVFASA